MALDAGPSQGLLSVTTKSEQGADRGPQPGSPAGVVVATWWAGYLAALWSPPAERSGDGALDSLLAQSIQSGVALGLATALQRVEQQHPVATSDLVGSAILKTEAGTLKPKRQLRRLKAA